MKTRKPDIDITLSDGSVWSREALIAAIQEQAGISRSGAMSRLQRSLDPDRLFERRVSLRRAAQRSGWRWREHHDAWGREREARRARKEQEDGQ